MKSNHLYNLGQQKFKVGRSCFSHLLDYFDKIVEVLEKKQNADVIYKHFAKAYDKGYLDFIAHKMHERGIT